MIGIPLSHEHGGGLGLREALQWRLFGVMTGTLAGARGMSRVLAPVRDDAPDTEALVALERAVTAARFGMVALAEGGAGGGDRPRDEP